MFKIFVHDLMTISRVSLLVIGQNDVNSKLLQPIVALICKVMTVKKPCVAKLHGQYGPLRLNWPNCLAGNS